MRPTEARALPEGASEPCDRLSALPESVLHVILSLLPARQAVQTSVLARSWRSLWCCVPCVAIDAREFGVGASRRDQPNWGRFERFATNLLARRCGSLSLDSFRLFAHGHDAPVDDWIRRAVECSPSVLEIATPFRASSVPGPPPSIVFPHLGSSPLCYRRLKRLRLEKVELDVAFTDLLRSCPALVDLELVRCDNCFWQLESDTLERIAITSCYDCFDPGRPTVITAPSLASLELGIHQDSFVHGVPLGDFACLVRASIYIGCGACFPERPRRRLLGSLFNVTSLQLTGFETLGMLHQNSKKFPTFPNLRNLSL